MVDFGIVFLVVHGCLVPGCMGRVAMRVLGFCGDVIALINELPYS